MAKQFSNDELAVLAQQLAMVLHSGISTLEGFSIMMDDLPDGPDRTVFESVYQTFDQTGDLKTALAESGAFPDYFIKMAEIGDRSGTLEEVFVSLSAHYDRLARLSTAIRDAILYPLVMFGMLFAVLIVLVSQVMPVFQSVFEQLGMEISGVSSAIFAFADVIQYVFLALLVVLVLLIILGLIRARTSEGRQKLLQYLTILPLGKKISFLQGCSHFFDALSLAIHSGLDSDESFDLAMDLSSDTVLLQSLEKVKEELAEGTDLTKALKNNHVISGFNARLLSVGFLTGSSEEAFRKISDNFEEEAEQKMESAVGKLEPTITAALSILTGLILVSVMLPLLQVLSNL